MDSTKLLKQIQDLPEILQIQVSDYVDFLVSKYSSNSSASSEENDLNSELLIELHKRFERYKENPEETVSIEDIKEEYRKRSDF